MNCYHVFEKKELNKTTYFYINLYHVLTVEIQEDEKTHFATINLLMVDGHTEKFTDVKIEDVRFFQDNLYPKGQMVEKEEERKFGRSL